MIFSLFCNRFAYENKLPLHTIFLNFIFLTHFFLYCNVDSRKSYLLLYQISIKGETIVKKKQQSSSFYQMIWRWHFYAGVIVAPFLFILAFSGGIYLFKPQIEGFLYSEYTTIEKKETDYLPYSAQAESLHMSYPDATISSVKISDQTEATEFLVDNNGVGSSIFVNPYSGDITGIVNNEEKVTEIVKRLHSELWIAGTIGNRMVELAACWGIILLITGLYIWWPRSKKAIWGTFLPRLNKKRQSVLERSACCTCILVIWICVHFNCNRLTVDRCFRSDYTEYGNSP